MFSKRNTFCSEHSLSSLVWRKLSVIENSGLDRIVQPRCNHILFTICRKEASHTWQIIALTFYQLRFSVQARKHGNLQKYNNMERRWQIASLISLCNIHHSKLTSTNKPIYIWREYSVASAYVVFTETIYCFGQLSLRFQVLTELQLVMSHTSNLVMLALDTVFFVYLAQNLKPDNRTT